MNEFVDRQNPKVQENVIAGAVGAFLFALVGGLFWFLMDRMGFYSSVSGLIGAICAVKGYELFAKKESDKGVIIAAVMTVLVMVMAWYLCLACEIYDLFRYWFEEGEVAETLTYFESVRLVPLFLSEPEVAAIAFKDLALGLFFCLMGFGRFISRKITESRQKPQKATASTEDTFTEKEPEAEQETESEVPADLASKTNTQE